MIGIHPEDDMELCLGRTDLPEGEMEVGREEVADAVAGLAASSKRPSWR
jgi:hypothetical protein